MSNTFMNGLQNATNYTHTENGAVTHKTTRSDLLDMFAMGAAMRNRPIEDIVLMFRKAYKENPEYALKCLFYIRDIRGGQGERRFFRACLKDMAINESIVASRLIQFIPEFGRWDDLYAFVGTPLEADAFLFIKKQLALDVQCNTPSLLAKWLKSENTSSRESCRLANLTRQYFGMNHKQYRKTLSVLRERIHLLERLMSENRWEEIEFDKIPSRAGIIYKNAFARRDIIQEKYRSFATDATKKVNAKTLYPYECVAEVIKNATRFRSRLNIDETNRAMINKYWDNLTDYFNGKSFNGIAVVDTSGSMCGIGASAPINVAISLGMYCAEKSNGPFAGHYVSFASKPQLIAVEGVDFCDKVNRIYLTNLCDNTNIEATFDLLLNTAIRNNCSQEDIPQNIIVISDMEFDQATRTAQYSYMSGRRISNYDGMSSNTAETVLEGVSKKWSNHGYKMPHLIFWNVDARHGNIPMLNDGAISYVSGFSPSIFESILSGKSGYDLMMETLNKERYSVIH